MRAALVAVLLVVVAAIVGHMHAAMQSYHPVVKLAAPEGLVYTALLAPAAGRPACGEAHRIFLGPVKRQCPQCQVLVARCERELQGLELALERADPIPHHLLLLPGIRMAIAGEEAAARVNCAFIAHVVAKRGAAEVACVQPSSASTGR